MRVRPEATGDFTAVATVVESAFGDARVARLVEAIRGSSSYVPELAVVATDDGQVVGHAMLSYARVRPGRSRILLLSPVAVRPDRQRRGIGSALVRHLVTDADRRGEPLVLVEGIPAYYPRFGFTPAAPLGLEPPRPGIPSEAFMALPLTAYDAGVRGRVVYPPAFDAFG